MIKTIITDFDGTLVDTFEANLRAYQKAFLLERFICVFGINPDPQVIDKLFKELILFTARAA